MNAEKIVYQTDPQGLFVGLAYAHPCPLVSGDWLIPGGCVESAPPDLGPHQAAKFADGAWSVIPDWRGYRYWTADRVQHWIGEAGIEPPEDALDADPGPTPAQRWATLQARAKSELAVSDITILRCMESALAVPSEWVAYRADLRSVVSAAMGDPDQALPARPAYPAPAA